MTPELLLPAGDFEKLRYALAYGADAVYLGIPKYSLRARENGFRTDSVVEAINYVHAQGKKAYLTANVIPHNHKVEPFIKYVGELLELCKPDAWIMSDPGIIMMMREQYPDETIHLSVQANTVNFASVRFWHNLGVKRIILSRELNLREIKKIHEECPEIELEAFVHGSICIAYSGRCLISNYMNGRDPNQGTCSHSCRWEYNVHQKVPAEAVGTFGAAQADAGVMVMDAQAEEDAYQPLSGDFYLEETERPGQYLQIDEDEHGTYLMNARDLCAIDLLDELRDAGVMSFKVEGRSKSLYYAATIARAYRRAIDDMMAGRPFDEAHMVDILGTANRGFIQGFLKGNPGRSAENMDHSVSKSDTHAFSAVIRDYDSEGGVATIDVRSPIRRGATLELVTPTETIPFEVTVLKDRHGNDADIVHSGINGCQIALPGDPGAFGLLREPLAREEG